MSRIRMSLAAACLVVVVLSLNSVLQAQAPGGPGGGGGGGRGGPGGGRGGFGGPGGNTTFQGLLARPEVQKEIKLTDAQKTQIEQINTTNQQTRRDQMAAMRNNNAGGGPPDFTAMRDAMTSLQAQSDAALGKILTTAQKKRLSEISLQQQGPLAVARPDIQAKLNIGDDQAYQINAIISDMQTAQQEAQQTSRQFFQQLRAQTGQGGGPGGGGGGGPGQAAATALPTDATAGQATDPAKAQTKGQGRGQRGAGGGPGGGPGGGFNNPAMQALMADPKVKSQMDQINAQRDKIRQQAIAMVGKVLTKKQKLAFNKMQGEPFTLDTPPGPGGAATPAATAAAAATTKATTTKSTTKSTTKAVRKTRAN